MTRSGNAGDEKAMKPGSAQGSARRPYRAPQLRYLGSVRELTLGGTMGAGEGAGTFDPKGKGKGM